jgi:hypothetical protein
MSIKRTEDFKLYQDALSQTHMGDSQGGDFLIQCCKLKEVCDGVGDWVAE